MSLLRHLHLLPNPARRVFRLAILRFLNSRRVMEARAALMPFRSREIVRLAMLRPLEVADISIFGSKVPRLELELTSGLRHIVAREAQAYQLQAELHSRVAWLALQPVAPRYTYTPGGPRVELPLLTSDTPKPSAPARIGVDCWELETAPVAHWRAHQREARNRALESALNA